MTIAEPRTASFLRWSFGLAGILLITTFANAQTDDHDLSQLNLDQLSKVEVTSVSKKEQKLTDTAAAVYVITEQDIRNSTATNLPELLHMVPGLDVAQISGSRWAISARGFNGFFQDRVLVLIDGRNVFDPLFSGLFWSEQDMPLQDIERIEVIRGPGATLWGANAVNGVINIITKPAQETQGLLVSAGIGTDERSESLLRYGGKLGKATSYRVYSKYFDDGPAGKIFGQPSHDSSRSLSAGFRIDTSTSPRDSFMVEGKGYGGETGIDAVGLSYSAPFSFNYRDSMGQEGENVLGRWIHKSSTGSETTVQASYAHLVHPQIGLDVNGEVVDASIIHERLLGDRHDLVGGLEFDSRSARTSSSIPTVSWDPTNPSIKNASAFLQDEILFANGAVRFTVGARLDYNSISGLALDPNVRLLWKVTPVHSVWVAYSVASETPTSDDVSIRANLAAFPGPTGTEVLRSTGSRSIEPEELKAFELGYRVQPSATFSLDLATFYNLYSQLTTNEAGQPFFEAGPPSRLVLPLIVDNEMAAHSFGGEIAARWMPVKPLRLTAAYSYFAMEATQSAEAFGNPAAELERQTPPHILNLSSSYSLPRRLTLNTALSFADRRTSLNVPGYTQVDSSLVWRAFESGEFKMGVKNLFNKEHIEFVDPQAGLSTVFGRSIYGRVTWRF